MVTSGCPSRRGLRGRLRFRGWIQFAFVAGVAVSWLFAGSPSSSVAPRSAVLKGVPFVAQLPNYCGPAALSSVFAYWGQPVSQSQIARRAFDAHLGATNGGDLLLVAREEGYSAWSYLSSLEQLKGHIRAGLPVLVLQDLSKTDRRGHYRVVVGYNDATQRFVVRDSNYQDVRQFSYGEFESLWAPYGRWALIICPKEWGATVAGSVKQNPILHLDLGQAFLRRNENRMARVEFETTLKMEPRNVEALKTLSQLDGKVWNELEPPSG